MAKLLDNAIAKLQELAAELNTDQDTIDSLNTAMAALQTAKDADDLIIANELILDKKESILDYLRGKGRAIREGAIIITASEQEHFNVPLSDVSNTTELALVMQGFTNAGFSYSVFTL